MLYTEKVTASRLIVMTRHSVTTTTSFIVFLLVTYIEDHTELNVQSVHIIYITTGTCTLKSVRSYLPVYINSFMILQTFSSAMTVTQAELCSQVKPGLP